MIPLIFSRNVLRQLQHCDPKESSNKGHINLHILSNVLIIEILSLFRLCNVVSRIDSLPHNSFSLFHLLWFQAYLVLNQGALLAFWSFSKKNKTLLPSSGHYRNQYIRDNIILQDLGLYSPNSLKLLSIF